MTKKKKVFPSIPPRVFATLKRAAAEQGQAAVASAIGVQKSCMSRILGSEQPTCRPKTLELILAYTNGNAAEATARRAAAQAPEANGSHALDALSVVVKALEPLSTSERERVVALAQLWLEKDVAR